MSPNSTYLFRGVILQHSFVFRSFRSVLPVAYLSGAAWSRYASRFTVLTRCFTLELEEFEVSTRKIHGNKSVGHLHGRASLELRGEILENSDTYCFSVCGIRHRSKRD